MLFDPMPIVHVYPHDIFDTTGHKTDDSHECWCEPNVVIVPPGHPFAQEDNITRVFYHTSMPFKHDWMREAPPDEIKAAIPINKLLRSIPEPPEGGWETIERHEGIVDLIADVLKNGWKTTKSTDKRPE